MDQDFENNRNKIRYRSAGELKGERFQNTFYRAVDNNFSQGRSIRAGTQPGSQNKAAVNKGEKSTPKGKKQQQKKKPFTNSHPKNSDSELFSKFVQMVKNQKD